MIIVNITISFKNILKSQAYGKTLYHMSKILMFLAYTVHICMIYHRNSISILKVSSILVITALSWLHDHIITFPTRFSAFHNQQLKYEY